MSMARSVSEILNGHVTLELAGIDRLYGNVYVPRLQTEAGVSSFFRFHRGHRLASSVLMDPISQAIVQGLERYAREREVDMVSFRKRESKTDIAKAYLKYFDADEGVLFIGKAQEKSAVFRTERRQSHKTGGTYPWLVRSRAMVNQYYVYGLDQDFGPFFLNFGSYFSYNAKLCINGHEWLKRQLDLRGIGYETLHNDIAACEAPKVAQALCDRLTPTRIEALVRKWLKHISHPFSTKHREAGYHYDISIQQAEFSLTQVLDSPLSKRAFFQDVIRKNLDIGRPDQAQLIIDRRVSKRTPGVFRTRVITEGVIPSEHVDYKGSRFKQHHKEGRALRTETTINNTRDIGTGKRLENLPALRSIGLHANRRLLDVQCVSHDCAVGEDAFNKGTRPVELDGQRASALCFGDERRLALLNAILLFSTQPEGFTNAQLRAHLATLQGLRAPAYPAGRISYDLRRLRLHALIQRIPKTNRYRLTEQSLESAIFFTRTYLRLFRPSLAEVTDQATPVYSKLRAAFDRVNPLIDQRCEDLKLAA